MSVRLALVLALGEGWLPGILTGQPSGPHPFERVAFLTEDGIEILSALGRGPRVVWPTALSSALRDSTG